MSFGFSVGDFIAVFDRANKLRKAFVGAPAQFKALSDELRSLSIIAKDLEVDLSATTLSNEQQNDVKEILQNCGTVLGEIEKIVDKYSEGITQNGIRRIWKRLIWVQEDVDGLRIRLCSNIGLLNAINGRIARDGILELLKYERSEQNQSCLVWLSPTAYAIQQSEAFNQRTPGTFEWLLQSPEFQSWIENTRYTLLCNGIPGAGKTIFASAVNNELESRYGNDCDIGIAYFFCSYQHYDAPLQKPEHILATILRQLAQGWTSIPETVTRLYDSHRTKGTVPSFSEMSLTLRSVISGLSRVFIVVDALDECNSMAISQILHELSDIQQHGGNLNVLATARFFPETDSPFQNETRLEIRAVKADVMKYVSASMERLHRCVSRDTHLQSRIIDVVSKAANGMFLLARLHLNSLSDKLKAYAIKKELDKIERGSNTYYSAYYNAMKRIECQGVDRRSFAFEVLSWVVCTRRPIKALELQHALAVEPGESEFHHDNIPDLEDIISSCAGLVTVTVDAGVIRFVHYTAQEYFQNNWKNWFPNAHSRIGTACMTYISMNLFQSSLLSNHTGLEAQFAQYPFCSYAATNWGYHARNQNIAEDVIMDFLTSQSKVDSCVQLVFRRENSPAKVIIVIRPLRDSLGYILLHSLG